MTKRSIRFARPVLISAAVAAVVWVGAGDLNPPAGPISPTNRVQLNWQTSLPYAVNLSGSYVLTSDLTASGPGNGIEINVSNVSLDLNGFGLFGAASGSGIYVNGAQGNISITNGTVAAWGDHGIDLTNATASRVSEVRVTVNGLHGIRLGSDNVVMDCIAQSNGDAGFRAEGNHNRIERNHSLNNARGFFLAGTENLLVKNSAADNGINYVIGAGNGYGPIVTASANLASLPGGDHPWANFALTCQTMNWCRDADADGFGNPADVVTACAPPSGYVADCEDCDDGNDDVNPGAPELCDSLDNNCDGQTDEGDPQLGQACSTGQFGICSQGTFICQGGSLVCQPDNFPTAEMCNGLDDDCDGVVDESDPQLGQACSTGQPGVCNQGTIVCQGGALMCQPTIGPSAEVCNGVDDDCDGAVDEGLGTIACGTGQCQNTVPACVGGSPNNCTPGAPSAETCDGIDNDCDGTVDEGNPCPMGFICVGGVCQALLSNGSPCSMTSQCASGFCVDGVCCNTSCTATCVACSAAKKGSGADGTCGNITAGTDPDGECSGGTPNCNGAGACGP